MSDPTYQLEQSPPRHAHKPFGMYVAMLALGLAATGMVAWYVMQRESPTVVVQRFWAAMRGDRWEEAYDLIDWPEGKKPDEKTFVQTAKTLRAVATIQKYLPGEAHMDGDVAVVPVSVTISISSFTGMIERKDTVDMRCRRVDGQWKVRPVLKPGFLGLGKLTLPGT